MTLGIWLSSELGSCRLRAMVLDWVSDLISGIGKMMASALAVECPPRSSGAYD